MQVALSLPGFSRAARRAPPAQFRAGPPLGSAVEADKIHARGAFLGLNGCLKFLGLLEVFRRMFGSRARAGVRENDAASAGRHVGVVGKQCPGG